MCSRLSSKMHYSWSGMLLWHSSWINILQMQQLLQWEAGNISIISQCLMMLLSLYRRSTVMSKTAVTFTESTDLRCASIWSTSFWSSNSCLRSTWWTVCSRTSPSCRSFFTLAVSLSLFWRQFFQVDLVSRIPECFLLDFIGAKHDGDGGDSWGYKTCNPSCRPTNSVRALKGCRLVAKFDIGTQSLLKASVLRHRFFGWPEGHLSCKTLF